MSRLLSPLLTRDAIVSLQAAHARGDAAWRGSLDAGRTEGDVALGADGFEWGGARWPWPAPDDAFKDRNFYAALPTGSGSADWHPVQRFGRALIKLIPTEWGPPTFEIDGIKMLPTAQVSPWEDAATKVALAASATTRRTRWRTARPTCRASRRIPTWSGCGD
jgi:predicted methyltransferase